MTPSETEITQRIIKDALARGYSLSVDDGEDITVAKSTDFDEIFNALGSVDEDRLIVFNSVGRIGSILFVYGNEDGVVAADYATALEPMMEPINEWAEAKWGG